jgi:hypothetical protein
LGEEDKGKSEAVEDSITFTEIYTRKFVCPNPLKRVKGKTFKLTAVKGCCTPVFRNNFNIALDKLIEVNEIKEKCTRDSELTVSLRDAGMMVIGLKTLTMGNWGKSAKEVMIKLNSQ